MTDTLICQQIVLCIAKHLAHAERDGYANSQGHILKIREDIADLQAILHGGRPEMVPHI